MAETKSTDNGNITLAPAKGARQTVWIVTVKTLEDETLPIVKVYSNKVEAIATALLMEEGNPVRATVGEQRVCGERRTKGILDIPSGLIESTYRRGNYRKADGSLTQEAHVYHSGFYAGWKAAQEAQ